MNKPDFDPFRHPSTDASLLRMDRRSFRTISAKSSQSSIPKSEALKFLTMHSFRKAVLWISLALTLLSGILLRYQWATGDIWIIEIKQLIHAHSHQAMLGWLFWGILLLFYHQFNAQRSVNKILVSALLVVSLLIFPAFLYQGYGTISITLSSLHIFLSYPLLIMLYRKYLSGAKGPSADFWNSAGVLYVCSTIGPFMLAGSGAMGQGWMESWIAYYLHTSFNGWITFALVGWLFHRYKTDDGERLPSWICTVWMFSVFGATLPLMEFELPYIFHLTGLISLLLYSLIGVYLGSILLRNALNHDHPNVLIIVGLVFFLFKQLLAGSLVFPSVTAFAETHNIAQISFTHVALLGFSSVILIQFFYRRQQLSLSIPFLIGVFMYVGFLLFESATRFLSYALYFNIQRWYLWSGGVIFLGWLLMAISSFMNAKSNQVS